MDAQRLFEEFRSAVLGRQVTDIWLAANSLIVDVDCTVKDRGFSIWLEPTWHVSSSERVLAGSRQAQGAGLEGATKDESEQVAVPLKVLRGLPITGIDLDNRSNDLTLTVDHNYLLRAFVADPNDNHTWHIRDKGKLISVYGSPSGLQAHKSLLRTRCFNKNTSKEEPP